MGPGDGGPGKKFEPSPPGGAKAFYAVVSGRNS